MPSTAETFALSQRQRAELAAILDARQAAVASAWDAAWGAIADEVIAYADMWAEVMAEYGRLGRIPYARRANLDAAREHITATLGNVNASTRTQTLRALQAVVPRAEEYAGALALSQNGITAWLPTDPAAIDAIVRRSTEQITVRSYALTREATAAMKSALRVGVAAGDNPRAVARRMVKATEGAFNGGLARAEVIARTEVLDAYRAASHESMRANEDVLSGWVWYCELSNRSCPACVAMAGSEHPLSEDGPNDHHQGRCTAIPQVKTRKELGLPGPEPKPVTQDGVKWFKAQPESVQREILGNRGYTAWKSTNYPPSKWAQKVSNPDWRPSIRTRRPPEPKVSTPKAPTPPAPPKPKVQAYASRADLVEYLKGINPVSKIGNNCSNCAPAFELKARDGVNRVAKYRPKGRVVSDITGDWRLPGGAPLDWTKAWTEMPMSGWQRGSSEDWIASAIERRFLDVLTEDGQRALVTTSWKGGGGHIMNAARHDGKVLLYDAQTGQTQELTYLVRHAREVRVMRSDHLTFIGNSSDYFATPAEATAQAKRQAAAAAKREADRRYNEEQARLWREANDARLKRLRDLLATS